jgi:nucleotide-binding universal stress UspA family protein
MAAELLGPPVMKRVANILVAIDFGEPSLSALDDAIDLARTLGASVAVMHAYESPAVALVAEGAIVASINDAARIAATAETTLREAVDSRADRGVKLQAVLRVGPAWRAIDDVASQIDADLIVLGTHGRLGILHALLGSVAEKVVRTARRPVLTIPARQLADAR